MTVNDQLIIQPGFSVDLDKDVIKYNGKVVFLRREYTYVLLNKPRGYVSTASDEKSRKTIMDLIDLDTRIFPVGRLDMTTTGAILLSDDGDLSFRLTHPKYKIPKEYVINVHSGVSDEDLKTMNRGVNIGNNEFVRCKAVISGSRRRTLNISIYEGKKHIVKKIVGALGYKPVSLDRVKFAGISLRKLPRGCWRYLSKIEVERLKKITGLNADKKN